MVKVLPVAFISFGIEKILRGLKMNIYDFIKRIFFALIVLVLLILIVVLIIPDQKIIKNVNQDILKPGFEVRAYEIEKKPEEQPFIDREPSRREREKFWEYYDRVENAKERTIKGG